MQIEKLKKEACLLLPQGDQMLENICIENGAEGTLQLQKVYDRHVLVFERKSQALVTAAVHTMDAVEDMGPETVRIAGRVGWMTIKALLQSKTDAASVYRSSQAVQKDWDSLKSKFSAHRAQWKQEKIAGERQEKQVFCFLDDSVQLLYLPGNVMNPPGRQSLLLLYQSRAEDEKQRMHLFAFQSADAAEKWVALVREHVPQVTTALWNMPQEVLTDGKGQNHAFGTVETLAWKNKIDAGNTGAESAPNICHAGGNGEGDAFSGDSGATGEAAVVLHGSDQREISGAHQE